MNPGCNFHSRGTSPKYWHSCSKSSSGSGRSRSTAAAAAAVVVLLIRRALLHDFGPLSSKPQTSPDPRPKELQLREGLRGVQCGHEVNVPHAATVGVAHPKISWPKTRGPRRGPGQVPLLVGVVFCFHPSDPTVAFSALTQCFRLPDPTASYIQARGADILVRQSYDRNYATPSKGFRV